jgi:hypothetical protein
MKIVRPIVPSLCTGFNVNPHVVLCLKLSDGTPTVANKASRGFSKSVREANFSSLSSEFIPKREIFFKLHIERYPGLESLAFPLVALKGKSKILSTKI